MRQTALGLFLLGAGWLWMAPTSQADIIPLRQIPIYAARLGVEPDMDSLRHDRERGQTHFTGKVVEPCKLEVLGFAQVQGGEILELTSMETGRWKAMFVSTGQVLEFDLTIEWTEDD